MRLIERLDRNYDGWILHAAATPRSIATLAPLVERTGARWMAWVKGFAAFKRNIPVAFAWEPVIVKAARKPVVSKRLVMRDWIQESITLRRGLTGAKPEAVCHWAFEMVAARPDDTLDDPLWIMLKDLIAGMGSGAGTEGHLLLMWGDVQEPSLRKLAAERNRLVLKAMEARLPDGPRPPEQTAGLIQTVIQGACMQWLVEPEGDLAVFMTERTRMLLSILYPDHVFG